MVWQCLMDQAVIVAVQMVQVVVWVLVDVAVVSVAVAVLMVVVLLMSRDLVEVDLEEHFVQLAFEVLEKSESDQADQVVLDQEAFDQVVEPVLEFLYQEELDQVAPVDDNLEHVDHHVGHRPLLQL